MKIVTYNVNGLKARISSHRSLLSFLNSLDADIICLQETKISRQELRDDIAVAEGYESFFSCTRTSQKGRIGYSGVATFCKVDTRSSNTSAVLPVAADEGFTGLLHCSKVGEIEGGSARVGCYEEVLRMGAITKHELLRLDSEGRCVVTDHDSFVLFNVYGPCVQCGDKERMQFKLNFFQLLQCRWEGLLKQGRRVIVAGDLNISPYAIDSCDPGPDFDENLCRKWIRSMLKEGGGPFNDIFRTIHPYRKEAFTCWSHASGAKEFNWGSRIDLLLAAGPCRHQIGGNVTDTHIPTKLHGFAECEVDDCDILIEFKCSKPDSLPRSLKLDGSDHAPVYVLLKEQSPVQPHDAPPLAARFLPERRGRQQSIVSLLQKKPCADMNNRVESGPNREFSNSFKVSYASVHDSEFDSGTANSSAEAGSVEACSYHILHNASGEVVESTLSLHEHKNLDESFGKLTSQFLGPSRGSQKFANCISVTKNTLEPKKQISKKSKKNESRGAFQSNLRTFFVSKSNSRSINEDARETSRFTVSSYPICDTMELDHEHISALDKDKDLCHLLTNEIQGLSAMEDVSDASSFDLPLAERQVDEDDRCLDKTAECGSSLQDTASSSDRAATALLQWRRIHDLMARSKPLCQGHGEPCVARIVKKPGPNIGRGFYVCARAKGPVSNPEAQCNHFEWASERNSFCMASKVEQIS